MKKRSTLTLSGCATAALMAAVLMTSSGTAQAHKLDVYHCGCNAAGDDLVWTLLSVSHNAGGHLQHEAGDIEQCVTPSDDTNTFTRASDDTLATGQNPHGRLTSLTEADQNVGSSCAD